MAPPPYSDLGKKARDVFGKGYHIGLMKLEVKSKTSSGVEFTSGGSSDMTSGKVTGSLETKYKLKEHGLTFTEKWTVDNQLCTTIDLEDKIMDGLKLTFDSSFSPHTGVKSGIVKTTYKHDMLTMNANFDVSAGMPVVNASAVVGHQGWLLGYQMAFNSAMSKLTRSNFAVGYSAHDFTLHTNVDDGQVFSGSVYHKVNSKLETGVTMGWNSTRSDTSFGIGCKYTLDKDASLRAKVNNSSQIGLGYEQRLRDGVNLTLSTLIDAKNFQQGGHKVGLALEIDA